MEELLPEAGLHQRHVHGAFLLLDLTASPAEVNPALNKPASQTRTLSVENSEAIMGCLESWLMMHGRCQRCRPNLL